DYLPADRLHIIQQRTSRLLGGWAEGPGRVVVASQLAAPGRRPLRELIQRRTGMARAALHHHRDVDLTGPPHMVHDPCEKLAIRGRKRVRGHRAHFRRNETSAPDWRSPCPVPNLVRETGGEPDLRGRPSWYGACREGNRGEPSPSGGGSGVLPGRGRRGFRMPC